MTTTSPPTTAVAARAVRRDARSTARARPRCARSTASTSSSSAARTPRSWARRVPASRRCCTASPASTRSRRGRCSSATSTSASLTEKELTQGPARPHRLHLPDVQPHPDADRDGEHHAADGARRAQAPTRSGSTTSSTPSACATALDAPPVGALRRSAAARRGRPRAREPARDHLRRRADRQPRLARPAPRSSSSCARRCSEFGQTIVMVTHDPIAAAYADRVVFLADGQHRRRDPRARPPRPSSTRCAGWASSAMWKVTRKGLAAHKIRFVLTALAVIIGVAFMSGTSVLTATIQQTFDDLFADIYHGTDAVVRSPEVLESDFGAGRAPERARRRSSTSCGRRRRRRGRRGQRRRRLRADRRQERQGRSAARTGPADASGSAGTDDPQLNQFHIVDGRPPRTADEIVHRQEHCRQGDLQGRRPGDGAHHRSRRRSTRSSASRSSAPPTASRARRSRCSRCPRRNGSRTRSASSARSASSPKPGVSPGAGAAQTSSETLGRRRLRTKYEVHHRQGDHQGEPGRDPQAARLPQHRARGLRGDRAHRRRVHHLQHVLDRGRAAHCARWRCSARSARAAARCSTSVIGESLVVGVIAQRDRRRRRDRCSRSGSRR